MVQTDQGKQSALVFGGFLFLAITGYMAVKMVKKNTEKKKDPIRKEFKAMNASQLKTPALA